MASLWRLIAEYPKEDYPKMITLASLALTHPVHTADCERAFSSQNKVTTSARNRLSSAKCDRFMWVMNQQEMKNQSILTVSSFMHCQNGEQLRTDWFSVLLRSRTVANKIWQTVQTESITVINLSSQTVGMGKHSRHRLDCCYKSSLIDWKAFEMFTDGGEQSNSELTWIRICVYNRQWGRNKMFASQYIGILH